MSSTEPLTRRLTYRLLAVIARLVCLTLRTRRVNAEHVDALMNDGRPCVVAFWHGSMIPGWFMHRPRPRSRVSALVSLSKDGAILASVLEAWGFKLIRGSSHIGGREALAMMTDDLRNGYTLCVTPDGPRGPRHVMKPGAAVAARRTGVPLVIAGIALRRKKILGKSWDRFEIPMPFSELCIWYGEPIVFEPAAVGRTTESDKQAFIAVVQTIETRLADVHQQAHRALGIQPV